ncbi:MAG: hypothetical protein JG782_1232, partial [Anaerophaga sp.]|nr:hypothetical protein [Anaerophaga sp.]
QKNMYKSQSCEFHQTNDLSKLYTDETSMAKIVTKEHV